MRTSREIEQEAGETLDLHAVCVRRSQGAEWSAWCPELEITRTGASREETLAALEEAACEELRRRGPGARAALREVTVETLPKDLGRDEVAPR